MIGQEIRVADAQPSDEQKAKGLDADLHLIAPWTAPGPIVASPAAIESPPLATFRVIAWTTASVPLVLGLSFYAFQRVDRNSRRLHAAPRNLLGRSGRTVLQRDRR